MTKSRARKSRAPKPGSDAVTGLETIAQGTRRILAALNKRGYVGIVLIDLAPFARIEREFGAKAYNLFLRRFAEIAREIPGSVLRRDDQLLVNDRFGEQLVIFLGEKRAKGALKQEDMEVVCDRIYSHLIGPTMSLSRQYFSQLVQPDVGYSFVIRNPVIEPHRIVQRLMQEARDIARSQRYRFVVKNRERLKEVIVAEQIETVFQPIIELSSGRILGYEALSRGPAESIWRDPGVMFSLAIETDLSFELDRLCRKLALRRAIDLPTDQHVFINTLPVSLHDPEFRGKYLRDFLAQVSLAPKNIVLEVTETMAVEEYETLQKSLRYYRGMGFAVAIDDAGTGYANLEMIMHLKP
jgi:EAL domain-containing protein (putative c-di-GMP-specific phosphodiesterase class I)